MVFAHDVIPLINAIALLLVCNDEVKSYLFLLLLFSSFLRSEILYTETFEWVEDDEEHIWPEGWTHNEYTDPSTGEETTSNWRIEDIPRLSTRGTRRPLVAEFHEFSYESVTIASAESLGDSWKEGPNEGDRWHPEGACIKFRFTLSSGTYATTLLREFMQSPINHMG